MGNRQRAFLLRTAAKSQGAPIDLAAPKEGIFASPSGICMVKGAPAAALAYAYINEMLGAELQGKIAGPTFSLRPTLAVSAPPGMPSNVALHASIGQMFPTTGRVGRPLGPRNVDLILRCPVIGAVSCRRPRFSRQAMGNDGYHRFPQYLGEPRSRSPQRAC